MVKNKIVKIILFFIVLSFGTGIRLQYLTPYFSIGGDPLHYYEIADSINSGYGPVKEFVFQYWYRNKAIPSADELYPPLFPYTIALFFKVLGKSVLSAKMVSFVSGILTLIVIFLIGNSFSFIVGLLAMLVVAVNYENVIFSTLIMRESEEVFILCLLFLLLIYLNKNDYWYLLAGVGILSGLEVLIKTQGIVYFIAILTTLWWSTKKLWDKKIILPVVFFLLIIFPYGWYTFRQFGFPFYSVTSHYLYARDWAQMLYEKTPPTLGVFLTNTSFSHFIFSRGQYLAKVLEQFSVWLTPALFLFAVTSLFYLNNYYSRAVVLSMILVISGYTSQGGTNLLNERYFLGIVTLLIPLSVGMIILLFSQVPFSTLKKWLLLLVLFVYFVIFDAGKFVRGNRHLKANENWWHQYDQIGQWIKNNTSGEIIIMTSSVPEVHYYSGRKTVQDPYAWGKAINLPSGQKLPDKILKKRLLEEINYYKVTHVLLADLSEKIFLEQQPELSLKVLYRQKEGNFYFCRITPKTEK